jgi:hypothetical protein
MNSPAWLSPAEIDGQSRLRAFRSHSSSSALPTPATAEAVLDSRGCLPGAGVEVARPAPAGPGSFVGVSRSSP